MGFPASYRLSAYVTPKSPKGISESDFLFFENKIQLRSNKACHKAKKVQL